MKIVGGFILASLSPKEYLIDMGCRNLEHAKRMIKEINEDKRNPPSVVPITHWLLHGMADDELTIIYEEKDGIVIKNLWKILRGL